MNPLSEVPLKMIELRTKKISPRAKRRSSEGEAACAMPSSLSAQRLREIVQEAQ
jgi:hypothetical protein